MHYIFRTRWQFDLWRQECLTGADIVVQVGDEVTKDEPLTTNPNVGGFGQAPVSNKNHQNTVSGSWGVVLVCILADGFQVWI